MIRPGRLRPGPEASSSEPLPHPDGSRRSADDRARWARGAAGTAAAVLGVLAITGFCWLTRAWFTVTEQAMLYLLGILAAAAFLSRRDAILMALGSVAALDYFFVPPYLGFWPANPADWITVAAFLATSLVVSGYASRARRGAQEARERERRTAAFYTFSRGLAGEGRVEEAARIVEHQVQSLVGFDAVVLEPVGDDAKDLHPAVNGSGPTLRTEFERDAALLAFRSGEPSGRGTRVLPTAKALYLPLRGPRGTHGVLAVSPGPISEERLSAQRPVLDILAALTAVALERAVLSEEEGRVRRDMETERMRSALLSGVSHDLRTPLATVTGAAGALLSPDSDLSADDRRELLTSIRSEGDRMGRLVADLLDLTRIEAGGFRVRGDWYALDELVASAVERVRPSLAGRRLDMDWPDADLGVRGDGVLIEQVVVNLLQNASLHTPAGSPIEVTARAEDATVVLEVRDRGPGIPADEMPEIFQGFHRRPTVRDGGGTGLGLSLCRAIVRAHAGQIEAENRPDGGSLFRVRLPREEEPALPVETEAAPGASTS